MFKNFWKIIYKNNMDDDFKNIFPIVTRVASKTIANDLLSVKPMVSDEKIKNEVKAINRDRKIDAMLENKEYEEMKIEDHPDYGGPFRKLFYMDYVYATQSS